MTPLEILLIAVGLAMDASAVSLAAGASGRLRGVRPVFRLSFHFGLFQGLMPVLGWYLGYRFVAMIAPVDHWVALALLGFVGARMIVSGMSAEEPAEPGDPSRGLTLIALSVATSLDALAIGLSLAVLGVRILLPSLVIGCVTTAMCVVGFALGTRLGAVFGRRMEVLGGLILIGIGARIVLVHTLGGP